MTSQLSIERIRELFFLADGQLRWKQSAGTMKAGSLAGSRGSRGYMKVKVCKKTYALHRVVFAFVHGYWPAIIDHKDCVKTNNHPDNLRECTFAQNRANTPPRRDNASGIKGVHWHKRDKKWLAQIKTNRKQIFLGSFISKDEAAAAYAAAAKEIFGEFARSPASEPRRPSPSALARGAA